MAGEVDEAAKPSSVTVVATNVRRVVGPPSINAGRSSPPYNVTCRPRGAVDARSDATKAGDINSSD